MIRDTLPRATVFKTWGVPRASFDANRNAFRDGRKRVMGIIDNGNNYTHSEAVRKGIDDTVRNK